VMCRASGYFDNRHALV